MDPELRLEEELLKDLEDFEATCTLCLTEAQPKLEPPKLEDGKIDAETLKVFNEAFGGNSKDFVSTEKQELTTDEEYNSTINQLRAIEAGEAQLDSDAENALIIACNNLIIKMANKVRSMHRFVRHVYAKRFPDLENLVTSPADYARAVLTIGSSRVAQVILTPRILLKSTFRLS
jgi:U4/U6 small nuclear ribonucleoprotein PRP31